MSEQATVLNAPPAQLEAISGAQSISQDIGKLVEALAKAQLDFQPILKEADNAAFMRGGKASKYATLDAVINATRPALAKNGLVLFQLPRLDFDAKRLRLTTKLAHSSGQWIESELTLPAADQHKGFTAHTVASAITYARRYAWQAVTGCVSEEDDDGNAAAGQGSQAAANEVAKEKITKVTGETTPALFYTWFDESQTARISGAQSLLETHRELLKKFWSATAGAIVVNGEQLDGLKYELEQAGTLFKPLSAPKAKVK